MIRRASFVALFVVGLLFAASAALAQARDFGRTTIRIPDATTAGDWYGTWVFENRARKVALWIDDRGERLRIRVKQVLTSGAETFATDWDGATSYAFGGMDGDARIVIDEADPNQALGSWHWRSTRGDQTMNERGRFTMFRAEDGRYAVLRFDEFEVERDVAGTVTVQRPPRVWTFRKASRRMAEWDELAF